MQSSTLNRQRNVPSNKQQIQVKKKSVLPFSKQLLSLQKKIQQVQDKNQLILQRIHKAYDFKKNKNKVYYEAPGYDQDEDEDMQFQREEFQGRGLYQQVPHGRLYPSIQPQYNQPRQFEITTARKSNSLLPTPQQNRYLQNVHIQTPYLQHNQPQNQHIQNTGVPLIIGLGSASYYPELHEQQIQPHFEHENEQENSHMSQSSEGEIDFKSNSNYSDVERRKKIAQNVKRREKDFSDIKSNIQQRRTRPAKIQTKPNPKKSYIYNVIENNSLYSEGNVPSKEHLEGDDLEAIETPITVQPISKPKSPHKKQITPIPSQQRISLQSAHQLQPNEYFLPQNYTISTIPHPSPQMTYSVTARNPLPYQSQISTNQVNFLQQIYKTEKQKSLALQKQMEKKQQSIQHLKKYKKSFKRFFQDTHYVIQEAFDQFVETFLRNRVYKIQKLVKKNENRLSALTIQLKDFKQEQTYQKSLKSLSTTKIVKKSLSINEHFQRQSLQLPSQQDGNTQQNYSTVSSRSRDRSLSGRKRRSQDKSVAKKSNKSQHLIMKKQFDTIAENYQKMIKVKNEEIEKYEAQIKQAKANISALQEENNRLKLTLQQYQQNQSQFSQQQSQFAVSNSQSDNNTNPRRNSGNLRILSRNSSRSEIKKSTNLEDNEQMLMQKIKKYKEQIDKLQGENGTLEQKLEDINQKFIEKQLEVQTLTEKFRKHETQINLNNTQQIDRLQQNVKNLNDKNIELTAQNNQLNAEIQMIKERLNEKEIKILQLDSEMYMKDSELKKVENLLTLKTHKLQEFNKLILQPSGNEPLNDSISSVIEDPHNKTTFLMLENLEKQLEQEKYEKEIEFLKLKKSYQTKIQQLKAQFQEIAQQNQKLGERLNSDEAKKKQWEQDKANLQEINQHLKEQIEELHKEVAFLTDKVNFFEIERKTGSFGIIPKKSQTLLLKSESNSDLLKPHLLEQQDFEDFHTSEQHSQQSKQNQNWKSVSGEIKLLEQSNSYVAVKGKRSPSEQNQYNKKNNNANLTNQNLQNKLSLLKDQNIDLSQKVAKLQKQNKFLKQNQAQLSSRSQSLKEQLASFTKKYQELQLCNHELVSMIENLEKQKIENDPATNDQNGASPFDWKQVEKNVEPVDLKGSVLQSPWSFAEKDEFLLDRTSKDFDIRGSVVSNFTQNRPSKQSYGDSDKKIEQLTKKLAQTELLLENKQKINQELIIGFTKKIDKINTQNENHAKQQAKAIQKYIQENSKLRKQKQKIEEETELLKTQLTKLKDKLKKSQQHIQQQNFDSGVQELNIQNHEDDEDGFGMLQQRIQGFQGQGFMLGINQVDNESNKTPQKQQKVKFSTILEEDNIQFEDFEEREEKIELLQKQTKQLQQTIEQLQKFLQETLNKVKQKQDQKTTLVEELHKKNQEVEELRDLIELKQVNKNNNLSISKQLNGAVDRPSIQKSYRSRMNSVISLKYSQTHHGQRERRSSFDDDINFDFLESNNNQSINLDHSRMSGIYSENMSMIFEKEQNFLDQIKKAKNKRKEEGRLLKKTFQYIKKLRTTLNEKNKKIKLLEMRLQELKDNCWLWKKRDDKKDEGDNQFNKDERLKTLQNNDGSNIDSQQHNYLDHNQSLSDEDRNKLVDSRVFDCNSQDLNKKKPYRHNHYKKMEFDTKLIVEENKILNKQIELLQQELIKIQEQQNGLMAVKELYKEEIRALTRQNQQQSLSFQQQIQKMQDKLESSEAVHNFEAIKQLFKKIIDSIGTILYPHTSSQSRKKNVHQLKEQKRKQAQECIKVVCSILNYEQNIKSQICQRLMGQQS